MNEHKEILYWRKVHISGVKKILDERPLGSQPAFYCEERDQYFSSNPNSRFLSIEIFARFMRSHALVSLKKGLKAAESLERTADWRKRRNEHCQLVEAIKDIRLLRGAVLEKA